jgi:hypothetical protein
MPSKTGGFCAWPLVRSTVVVLCAMGAAAANAAAQVPRFVVELEAGPAWQSYNDVEIPNDGTATRFSLYGFAGAGPWLAGRLYVTWNISERHGVRLLAAPFSLTEVGTPDQPIRFAGGDYRAGEQATATYTFNSYRLTYRYLLHAGDRSTVRVGATAKIRDAVISLEQGATATRKTDLGFVPLLHLAADWHVREGWGVMLDVDALAGGPGRAIDAALSLQRELGQRWSVRGGYRMVEGGADVDAVYTFVWLHYATVALAWRR